MKKTLMSLGIAWLCFIALIVAAVMAVVTKLGSDNTGNDIQNAGFGGGISKSADVPDWLRTLIYNAISKYGCPEVTPALLASQLYQESSFDPKAESYKIVKKKDGTEVKVPLAQGIAQFIPGTWKTRGKDGDGDGDKNVWDPVDAVPAAVDYDCDLVEDVLNVPGDKSDNMLAAYNAGPFKVQKYNGIPPYEETRRYVREIRERAEKWAAPMEGKVSGGLDSVVAGAKEALGTPYLFGGTCKPPFSGGNRCDCSSLVKYAWSKVGVNLPRTSYDQVDIGTLVKSVNDLRPGDLIFTGGSAARPEHVSMYIGESKVIDAPRTGHKVRIEPLSYWRSLILIMKRPNYTEPRTGGVSGTWVAPVADDTVGTGYRVSGSMWSSGYHTGIDFPVPTGTAIRAVGPGTVVTAGWNRAYGYQVVIRHGDGKYSQYAHLSSLIVMDGQKVMGSDLIGYSGATGNVSGPHLHFEIRTRPEYGSDIDPLRYLRSQGVKI
ncbi:peptidoglycan DD-metalloendopeptidase family protein [Streptomyces zaomyceticus]|uniref:peptidoglycan DD-metalloendopeptidase family protein n=1 Tax=Streptomyces zaomyceticus TaxID=68286 RepID=UPI0036C7C0C4